MQILSTYRRIRHGRSTQCESRSEKTLAHALLVTVSPAITSYSNKPLAMIHDQSKIYIHNTLHSYKNTVPVHFFSGSELIFSVEILNNDSSRGVVSTLQLSLYL